MPAGNHRSRVNDIVVFVPPNQKIPGKGHIIVADKAGFVHFFCIQHKHGVSVPYEDQFLTVERKSFFKGIFHGSIPRRVFPYGKPFSVFRLKVDRNIFQPSIGKGKQCPWPDKAGRDSASFLSGTAASPLTPWDFPRSVPEPNYFLFHPVSYHIYSYYSRSYIAVIIRSVAGISKEKLALSFSTVSLPSAEIYQQLNFLPGSSVAVTVTISPSS